MKEKLKNFWNEYKGKKRTWIGLILVIVILFFIFHKKAAPVSAEVATATRTNVTDSVVLSGRTESASAVNLGFADQGRVSAVNVKEGDKVSAGQVLASLDTSDLDASLKNAQASLIIAKAGVSTSSTNVDKVTAYQDSLVANAHRALLSQGLQAVPNSLDTSVTPPIITGDYTGSEGDYVIHVYSSASNSGASFDVSGLENGFTSTVSPNVSVPLGSKGLFIQFGNSQAYAGTTWTVSIPNTRSAVYTANSNAYVAAQAARDQAITAAQSELVSSNSNDSIAQAKILQAQASVDSILSNIGKRKIVAPFSGVVANVDIKPGQSTTSFGSNTSGAGTNSSITLISENDYQVVLKVPEISVSKVSVGQDVSITLDAYGSAVVFPGKVVSVNPAETIVDGVPVYETKVVFAKPDDRIKSGMTATATIVASRRDGVVSVPASFVHTNPDGSSYVNLVLTDDKTQKEPVTVGLRGSDSTIEITSGLDENQKVRIDPLP